MIILNQGGLVLCFGSMRLWKDEGVTLLCDMTQTPNSLFLLDMGFPGGFSTGFPVLKNLPVKKESGV